MSVNDLLSSQDALSAAGSAILQSFQLPVIDPAPHQWNLWEEKQRKE